NTLAEYYSGEGKQDPTRIEIPLGHYVPSFEPIPAAVESDDSRPAAEPAVEPQRRSTAYATVLVAALGLVALALSFWFGRASAPRQATVATTGTQASPAVSEIWGSWLDADQGPTIVFSSFLGAVVKHYPEPLAPDSLPPRYPVPSDFDAHFRSTLKLGSGGHLYLAPTLTDTKAGESLGAVQLAAMLAARGMPVRATTAALLTWEDFRQRNLILLGHNEQNSWMDPLLKEYPLQLKATAPSVQRRIVNTQP